MEKTSISIVGGAGKMGLAIVEEAKKYPDVTIKFLVEENGHESIGKKYDGILITDDIKSCIGECDVVIDFSSPKSTLNVMKFLKEQKETALVIGTTGFSESQEQEFQFLKKGLKVLRASNMSVGVNVMFKLTNQVTKMLPDNTNVEIVDVHHNKKKDAPSGTSLSLGEEVINGKNLGEKYSFEFRGLEKNKIRKENGIGFSSIRGGDVIGDHSVYFFLDGERIELVHRASKRSIYAKGAILAATWIKNKGYGLYNMKDIL